MGTFAKKLTRLLHQRFPNCELELEEVGGGRIGGLIIWDGFNALDHIDRQKKLSEAIKSSLTPTEQLKISAILAMTPAELANARQ